MADELSFEDALKSLEQVVDDLERGEPELSSALKKYELGVKLLAQCQTVLEKAERSVSLLTGVDASGNPISTPFNPATAPEPEPTPKATKPPKKRTSSPSPDSNDSFIPF